MRPRRLLLLPLTLLLALAAAAPAAAVDWTVEVTDFEFAPAERRIEVGDKVVWRFHDGGHTATSRPGQDELWDSGLRDGGGTYEHVFTKPGRYDYVCTPHETFMAGVIQVGEDIATDTVDSFKTKRRGRTVTVSFKLNEPASMTYRLKGPSRRTIKRARLGRGGHRFKLRRLKRGRYRGTLTLQDDFGNTVRPAKRFVVR